MYNNDDNNNNNNNKTQFPQHSDDPPYALILSVMSCRSPKRSLAYSCFKTKRLGKYLDLRGVV